MPQSTPSSAESAARAENVAGMLAYLTFVPAVLLLFVEPYRRNRRVRFHAWQCIDLTLAWTAVELVLWTVNRIAPDAALPLGVFDSLFTLALFVLWIMLMIKTVNGQKYRLPVIGALAEKQATANA